MVLLTLFLFLSEISLEMKVAGRWPNIFSVCDCTHFDIAEFVDVYGVGFIILVILLLLERMNRRETELSLSGLPLRNQRNARSAVNSQFLAVAALNYYKS